jgi:hypothetical protein
MGLTSKVYTPGDIFQNPTDLYVGITAPPSSLTPAADINCLALDASGQPSSATGFHVGHVDSPTSISITEKVNEILDDQHDGPVDVAFDSISAEIDFIMKETNLSRLQQLINGGNLAAYNAVGGAQVLQIGGQTSTTPGTTTLLMVSPRRDVPGKFIYALWYKVYISNPIELTFIRSKESVYKVKAHCLMDTTRVVGDELGQIVKQK